LKGKNKKLARLMVSSLPEERRKEGKCKITVLDPGVSEGPKKEESSTSLILPP